MKKKGFHFFCLKSEDTVLQKKEVLQLSIDNFTDKAGKVVKTEMDLSKPTLNCHLTIHPSLSMDKFTK